MIKPSEIKHEHETCIAWRNSRTWTPARVEVKEALREIAPYLAELYEGAVLLLYACSIPGRARLIAHAVREIGNALPEKIAGQSIPARYEPTNDLDGLVSEWDKCGFSTNGRLFIPDDYEMGTIPDNVSVQIPRRLYEKISQIVKRHAQSRRTNREKAVELFKACDPQNPDHMELLDPVLNQWLDVVQRFVGPAKDRKRSDDEILQGKLLDQFAVFETGLRALITDFFSTASEELDEILARANSFWKAPTPEEVSRAVALLSRAANYRHFFEKLENPLWIRPLWARRFFKMPPEVEYEDEGKVMTFPRWPESRYLARMAPLAPDDVAEVLARILDTDNLEVREDILRAVLAMPADRAVRFVDAAKKWVTDKFLDDFLAMEVGQLVSLLADGGKTDAALALARELFTVQPKDRHKRAAEQLSPFDLPPDPIARFGRWRYQEILEKNIPHLVDAAGLDAISMLCDLLEGGLHVKESRKAQERRLDLSCIWRPAIEDHEQNLGNTVLDALISSLRDSVERVCSKDPESIAAVVELLEKRGWPVFQGIGLYLLSRFAHKVPLLAATRIADEKLFDNEDVLHEYHHLCRVGFAQMSLEAKEKVLGWIKSGLERETVAESIRSDGQEPTDQRIDEIMDGWRLHRLTAMKDHLTGEWAEYYRRLVGEMGEPEHPDFASWYETTRGPKSPLTPRQISAMPMTHILTFMRTWEPPPVSLLAPSAEELGSALKAVVVLHPRGFAALANEFIGLEPTYIRSLLSGLQNAARSGMEFDWKQVLALCEWVTQQPLSISGRPKTYQDKDPDWGWTRGQIADLLSEGFSSERSRIPFDHRGSVWRILEPLTGDPYPPVDVDSTSNDTWRQPSMDSWNTTRGKAMHAVIRYAIWVRQNFQKASLPGDSKDQGFAIMPEVKSVLEAHLDINLDPGPATRSVYGQWLPSLVWLDKEWVSSKLEIIFPSDEGRDSLWKAAWIGYITSWRVHRPVFEMLRNEYRRAIGSLGQDAANYFRSDPDSRLAEHLMTVYWIGGEPLESENSLVRDFFEKSTSNLQAHALDLIGSWLQDHPLEITQDIAERLKNLWEWRRDVMEQSDDRNNYGREAAQFGLWFVSGKLDEHWALEQLRFAIEFSGQVGSELSVVERLAALAGRFPLAVADCLDAMVGKVTKPWHVYSLSKPAFEALRAVLESGDPGGSEKAKKVANRFGELGFREFRGLVSPLRKKA